MTTVNFVDYLASVRRRKQELGVVDTPASTEAMRNKGNQRVPEKRALLAAAAERSRDAGREPVSAYY
jgi:hypothetical protein